MYGQEELYLDLRFGYRGKIKALGDRNYRLNLNLRNALDDGDDIPVIINAVGDPVRMGRVSGRQIVLSVETSL